MTFKRFIFRYRRFTQRLGPRVLFYVFLSGFAAVLGHELGPLLPDRLVENLKDVDVQPILSSLSATMLTISTFSLSIIVSANANAVASTTPRAFKLLLDDQGTRNMLAKFLGAFVFSDITLMILPLGYYGGGGRVILLAFTIWIVINILVSFIRWVMMVRELGSMSYALGKIETATSNAMLPYLTDPYYGCNPLLENNVRDLESYTPIYDDSGEYIQLIDEAALQLIASNYKLQIFINLIEGDFVSAGEPLVYVDGNVDPNIEGQIQKAFLFGDRRDILQDPRFGFTMLYQTASKALSPGINDPGTANDCIHTAYRLFKSWQVAPEFPPNKPLIWKRSIDMGQVIRGFYDPITHDGGDVITIHLTSLQTLAALYRHPAKLMRDAAKTEAKRVYDRALVLLQDETDKKALHRAFSKMNTE